VSALVCESSHTTLTNSSSCSICNSNSSAAFGWPCASSCIFFFSFFVQADGNSSSLIIRKKNGTSNWMYPSWTWSSWLIGN